MEHKINASQKIQSGIYTLGVVGAILSWNYPFHNLFNPVLATVFSGNGIVVKGLKLQNQLYSRTKNAISSSLLVFHVSEHASWSGCFYVRILQTGLAAVGAPENLVEVMTGFAETGEALVSSVEKIIFDGSPVADTLIPVTLELGGKDPFIVCEDVDVAHVAQVVVRASLQSSVQNCAGAERFYVHKDIYASFVAAVVKIGPPQLGKYNMGVICMQDHSERLQSLINDALDKGAEIVGGGNVRDISEGAVDQYFPPTVIVNVNHRMKLMQEELPCKNCDKYGCITSAETVMLEKQSVDEFLSNIKSLMKDGTPLPGNNTRDHPGDNNEA
uniref:Aldehyde dehydrogenase domain-containing protein n=1 Tax=Lactuca sativa TaxID=4236 RepID=A0A9R1W4R2_LACSA|nr:hypothetical protein LSAT_V11C300143490 [Lactuca sativa]